MLLKKRSFMANFSIATIAVRASAIRKLALDYWNKRDKAQQVKLGLALAGLVVLVGLPAVSAALRIVGIGRTSFLPADQRQYFNELGSLRERMLHGFEPTRAGETERQAVEKEFKTRFSHTASVSKWRCLVTAYHPDGTNCEMRTRQSECTKDGATCPVPMSDVSPVMMIGGFQYSATPTSFLLIGPDLHRKRFYFGDLVEFDGSMPAQYEARFDTTVHVGRVDLIAKEYVSLKEWKR